MSWEHALVRARLSQGALARNLQLIRQFSDDSPIWAVLKANAYGHQLASILPLVVPQVDGIACARLEEAIATKKLLNQTARPDLPLLILGGCYDLEDLVTAYNNSFQLVVHTWQQLEGLQQLSNNLSDQITKADQVTQVKPVALRASGQFLGVWVKINVGMNRLGFAVEDAMQAIERLQQITGVKVLGVLAHLGTADEPEHPQTIRQMQTCVKIFAEIRRAYPSLMTSLSNSAHLFAIAQKKLDYPWHGMACDWVRPGICMYGASPLSGLTGIDLQLQPVMTLEARVVSARKISVGDTVGYGATWQASEPGRLFVVAIGYGDGFPRHIQNAQAYFKGALLQQAGRVSMDFTMFFQSSTSQDQLSIPQATPQVGDYVELWGRHIAVDQVAAQSQSIGYERLTQLSQRVHYRVE